jgi:hypothetical protein
MDKIGGAFESVTGSGSNTNQRQNQAQGEGQSNEQDGGQQQSSGAGGFLAGLGDKLDGAVGGGKESEKNEDMLDKVCPLASRILSCTDILSGNRLRPREIPKTGRSVERECHRAGKR